MKIKLIDENLIGQPGLSRYIDPKTNWEREPENYDVGIYVDRMCFVIPKFTSRGWELNIPLIVHSVHGIAYKILNTRWQVVKRGRGH